jgi:glutamate synthase (NADPH) small chain
MGKPTGFLDFDRKTAGYRPVDERVRDYHEVGLQLPEEQLQIQGGRCMDCGIPFCHALGCPVVNLIPEWNDLVYSGQWREAYERLELTNNLPEITGRVCPAPCEASCTLSINTAPVTIKQIELAIIEKAFAEGWVLPRPPARETGRRIAIIGSGPSGLAAAQQLRRQGHAVTVYEKNSKAGGILRYGIPDFKLDKRIIDRRIAQMEAEGVVFECEVSIGEDMSISYLRRKHDAVLLTLGAGEPRDLHVPGRGYEGIHFAMDFLTRSNRFVGGEIEREDTIWAGDKKVLVIGGGDTGSDCVGTANRQGAANVYQFEIMPKPLDWKEAWNPEWPYWPGILRTSSSHEEGCERRWSITTKQFRGRGVRVEEAVCAEVQWEKTSKGMRPVEVPGSEFTLKVDLVLLSMGFLHVQHSTMLEEMGVATDERGNVKTDACYATSVPGIYAAGDAGTGASLVVRAIWHGRKAAECIGNYLLR